MKLSKQLSMATIMTFGVVTSICIPPTVQAAQLFNFQYSFPSYDGDGTSISASGILITTDLDPLNNNYTITGISGTRTAQGITEAIIGLLPPGTYGNNDNLLNASQPLLTINGFSYLVAGGGEDGQGNVNVLYSSFFEGYSEFASDVDFGSFSVTPHSVPEPNTVFSLLLTLGFCSRIKRKQSA